MPARRGARSGRGWDPLPPRPARAYDEHPPGEPPADDDPERGNVPTRRRRSSPGGIPYRGDLSTDNVTLNPEPGRYNVVARGAPPRHDPPHDGGPGHPDDVTGDPALGGRRRGGRSGSRRTGGGTDRRSADGGDDWRSAEGRAARDGDGWDAAGDDRSDWSSAGADDGGARSGGDKAARSGGDKAARSGGDKAARSGGGRGRSAGRGGQPEQSEGERAREICLRQLATRPRTRAELAKVLAREEISEEVIAEVLDRYDEVGIIDDAAFARAWVSSRHHGRGLARRALANELRQRGVDAEVASEALETVDDEDEAATARALVDRKLRTATGPPDAVFRRLVGMLARKGYSAGVAIRAVKDALAERDAEAAEFADQLDADALATDADPTS
ncbi:regulatory protein [Paractinoplanes brasiliensis]|uniref:Regulatory protein RecX n=1 Tax=Paractinoplanes brasiliensis TaxID=52695 RepID=A0A4R6JVN9_9ACTN|nr:regulatory protein RecX [Actinoplanes brasiliensis]TDO40810.1 regulatory protein [Actinoplanes brasiliensis]GID25879.1 hypothetical protein Abr02nite_08620 [Actinoplanes brasiliensis]